MISRRQLIGSGMVVSALGLSGRAAWAVDLPARHTTRAACFIVDTRFDEALEIAHQFAAPGARIIALPRDVLELWHDELLPTLESSSQAIAGVTTEYGFFTLRTLAADQRLRVQLTARHALPRNSHGDEALVSWVIGRAASRI